MAELDMTPPLKADHPIIRDDTRCLICRLPFVAGHRVKMMARWFDGSDKTVQADLAHADCYYTNRLVCTSHEAPHCHARIVRIKDGDASPFPIIAEPLSAPPGSGRTVELKLDEVQEHGG